MLWARLGIADLQSEQITAENLWETISAAAKPPATRRDLRRFIADAVLRLREDGEELAGALFTHTIPVGEPGQSGYPPAVTDAIEAFAKARAGAWFTRYQDAVRQQLGELPPNSLRLEADALAPGAKEVSPSFTVTVDDLVLSMILLAVIDNIGPNLSVLRSLTADSAQRTGETAGFANGVKARNDQVLRSPAPAGGLFSYIGLIEFVTAATTVDRAYRRHSYDFDRLLFVPTGADAVLGSADIHDWWSKAVRPVSNRLGLPSSLSFRKTRKGSRPTMKADRPRHHWAK